MNAHPSQLEHQRIPHWLVRFEIFLRVLLRMYIGLLVMYLPWSGYIATLLPPIIVRAFLPWSRDIWDQNPLFAHSPTLAIYAANGAVRGLVSGLGCLNLWIAIRQAIHYRNK